MKLSRAKYCLVIWGSLIDQTTSCQYIML